MLTLSVIKENPEEVIRRLDAEKVQEITYGRKND